jgi:hypothetical protein
MIITILRKPLEGTVAENTLKHGCGALNIDESRIETDEEGFFKEWERNQSGSQGVATFTGENQIDLNTYKPANGRWPANLILIHKEGCESQGTKKIKVGKKGTENGGSVREKGLYEDGLKVRANDPDQGEETISDWDCEDGCPVKNLDDQSGVLKSGLPIGTKKAGTGYHGNFPGGEMTGYGDSGGASRFFKQFKKEEPNEP